MPTIYRVRVRGGFRILEWEPVGGHNFKWGTHAGHIVIISIDPYIGLTSN